LQRWRSNTIHIDQPLTIGCWLTDGQQKHTPPVLFQHAALSVVQFNEATWL
jgi:hypothetical protein